MLPKSQIVFRCGKALALWKHFTFILQKEQYRDFKTELTSYGFSHEARASRNKIINYFFYDICTIPEYFPIILRCFTLIYIIFSICFDCFSSIKVVADGKFLTASFDSIWFYILFRRHGPSTILIWRCFAYDAWFTVSWFQHSLDCFKTEEKDVSIVFFLPPLLWMWCQF